MACRKILAWLLGISIAIGAAGAESAPIVLFSDDFNAEHGGFGAQNYSTFTHWTVTSGSVDLIDRGGNSFLPGTGLAVDLNGTTNEAGRLETKNIFSISPGIYELQFDLAGNLRFPSINDTVTVSLGSIFTESFSLPFDSTMTTIHLTIPIFTNSTGTLAFDHAGGDNVGLLIDNVQLTRLANVPVPEASSVVLIVSGLVGLMLLSPKRRNG